MRRHARLRRAALRLAAALLLAGSGLTAQADAPAPQRVITLAPHLTELLFVAGAGDQLVATVSSSNHPPAARALPRVGDGLSINIEQLLALRPTLVLAWQDTLANQRLAAVLTPLGIPMARIAPQTLADIPDAVEDLGERLGTAARAGPAAQALRAQIRALRAQHAHAAPVAVFIEVGNTPLYTLGKDPLTQDALETCAGRNVFADARQVAPTVGSEDVLMRQPQALIVTRKAAQRVNERRDYWRTLGLDAARRNHVYGMDPDSLLRPGPRLIAATARLCQILDRVRTADAPPG